jgi:hypothetical protein
VSRIEINCSKDRNNPLQVESSKSKKYKGTSKDVRSIKNCDDEFFTILARTLNRLGYLLMKPRLSPVNKKKKKN